MEKAVEKESKKGRVPGGQSRFGFSQSIQSETGIWSCESHEPGARSVGTHAPVNIAFVN